jgi:hypothetical protein
LVASRNGTDASESEGIDPTSGNASCISCPQAYRRLILHKLCESRPWAVVLSEVRGEIADKASLDDSIDHLPLEPPP